MARGALLPSRPEPRPQTTLYVIVISASAAAGSICYVDPTLIPHDGQKAALLGSLDLQAPQ
jgi:hypothetical protein